MSGRIATIVLAVLFVPGIQHVHAQADVSIRALNAVPQANLADLMDGGAKLSEQDILALARSPYEGDTVRFRAVVMSDPRNSGASEIVDGRVARVHFFVRDVLAETRGPNGMGLEIIDSSWDDHRVLELAVGDVVRVTGVVSSVQSSIAVEPVAIDRLGRYDSLGLGAAVLEPIRTFQVEELNRRVGPGQFQANWSILPTVHGSYVCFDRAFVERSIPADTSGRVDWAVSSTRQARMYSYDLSHRFRNDRTGVYPEPFNVRPDSFAAPLTGSTVDVCGFISLRGFNDPEGVGLPPSSTGTAAGGRVGRPTGFRAWTARILPRNEFSPFRS
jgi:hypothetical protein